MWFESHDFGLISEILLRHKLCDWICKGVLIHIWFFDSKDIYTTWLVFDLQLWNLVPQLARIWEIFGLIYSLITNKFVVLESCYNQMHVQDLFTTPVIYSVKHYRLVNARTEFYKNGSILNSIFQNSNSDSTEDFSWFLEQLM